jgi:hypothetical protein
MSTGKRKQTVRKPATKFAHLRKRMERIKGVAQRMKRKP